MMGESMNSMSRMVRRSLWLPALLFCLRLPAPALGFDLNAFLSFVTGHQSHKSCPAKCECTIRRAEDVMQEYVTRYQPYLASHMNQDLESELRSTVAIMTAWLGSMADIRCQLSEGDRMNLSDVLQSSLLSFKSVQISCHPAASVLWDVSPIDAFVNVLHLSGCVLEKAAGRQTMFVPPNLWVLELQGVPADSANCLDFSVASQLRTFSFTHSRLNSVPRHWSEHVLPSLLFVRLAHTKITHYGCEMKAPQLKVISLDHNKLTALPLCVLDGSKYTNLLSLRDNHIHNLQGLVFDRSEVASSVAPQVTYLDLAYNQVNNLRALKKMQRLLGLDLSHNHLDTVAPDTFTMHPYLEWLDLSNNFLEHVTDGLMGSLIKLKHFNLSHNHLRSFEYEPNVLSSKLTVLDLSHNRLIYPPFAGLAPAVPRRVHIHAAGNPYLCDCHLYSFLQLYNVGTKANQGRWLSSDKLIFSSSRYSDKKHPFVDISEMTCNRPLEVRGVRLTSLLYERACPLPRGCPEDCKCELVKEGEAHVSVDCSVTSLTELPDGVPFVSDTPVVLYVNKSGLKRLDHRPYLHRVKELHASDSKLSSVASDALKALQNVTVLDLHNTLIRYLPAVTQNLTLLAVTNLSLGGNAWTCGCRDLWMPDWMAKHSAALCDMDHVRCHWTGKLVTELTSADLNCGLLNYLPLVIALSLITGFIIITVSSVAKYKLEILVFIYTHLGLRPLDMYKYNYTKPFLFDVFLIFSEMDYTWVVEQLMEHLENRVRPYRLCTHLRDFPVGAPFADSVVWAMDNSRCTLLVVTRDFLVNEWNRPYFRSAHRCLFQDPKTKLLVTVHGPVDARCLGSELLGYMRSHLYLKTEEFMFWSKLDYALPRPQELMMVAPGPDGGGQGRQDERSVVTEIGGSYLLGALAAGDVTQEKYDGSSSPSC